ncbi:hypothetical protein [Parafrankia sp. FMc2]|uniref:hypothetical protein n=1 Tax=Parafrankia sp. FMc2 TaxID=3233196 RepID=UPI0034D6165D
MFLVNLPIGATAFIVGALFLIDRQGTPTGRFDAVGFVLSAVGFALVLYALSVGPAKG